jgi:hypothetical protein
MDEELECITIQFGEYIINITLCKNHILLNFYGKIEKTEHEIKINNSTEVGLNIENMCLEGFFEMLKKCFNKEAGHNVYFINNYKKIVAKFNVSLYGVIKFDFDIVLEKKVKKALPKRNKLNKSYDGSDDCDDCDDCYDAKNTKDEIQRLKNDNEYIMIKNDHFKKEIESLNARLDACMKKIDGFSGDMLNNVLIGSKYGTPIFTNKNNEIDIIEKIGYSSDLYLDSMKRLNFPMKIDFSIIDKNNISIYIDSEKVYNKKDGLNDQCMIFEYLNNHIISIM